MGELEGLRQPRRKGGDTDLKAARLKYPVQVCFLRPGLFTNVDKVFFLYRIPSRRLPLSPWNFNSGQAPSS